MFASLLHTQSQFSLTILRFMLALVLFPHGAQKLFGWFGGYGFKGTMGFFTGTVGLPWVVAFSVIMVEVFAPLFLISGLVTRGAALAVSGLFLGIVLVSHAKNGFWMNWNGQLTPGLEGFEYHLLVLGMTGALIIGGGGKWALDSQILSWFTSR
jgi:putative oxidoreductase